MSGTLSVTSKAFASGELPVLDVRDIHEFEEERIGGAYHAYVGDRKSVV